MGSLQQSWLFSWLLSRPDILGTMGPASWLSRSGSVPTPKSGSLFTITVLKSFSELASEAWSQRVKRSCQPQVHGLGPWQGSRWVIIRNQGENTKAHGEKTPNSNPARSAKSLSAPSSPKSESGCKRTKSEPESQQPSGGREPAPRAHIQCGRVQAGGGRAPGPRSPAASLPLLRRTGPGGAAGGSRGASRAGKLAGEVERCGPSRRRGARS